MDNSRKVGSIQEEIDNATGNIDYNMTNDYMFRAVLQKNEIVLKGLICALLRLSEEEIISINILNPIELGKAMGDKEFILDIKVLLNNHEIVNLEMQVNQKPGWEERSLSYLCRSFDRLNRGDEYENAGPAIHIGILDYTPYSDAPEFYSSYKLMNLKTHRVYTDKFTLNMLSLKQIGLATDEDKRYKIDTWAKLFKAKTWEELKMLEETSHSKAIEEATKALYILNSDMTILDQCYARQDYERMHRMIDKRMEELESKNAALKSDNVALKSDNAALETRAEKLEAEVARLKVLLAERADSTDED
jgi:predicted transposase/invertase (TIGR01784 family)